MSLISGGRLALGVFIWCPSLLVCEMQQVTGKGLAHLEDGNRKKALHTTNLIQLVKSFSQKSEILDLRSLVRNFKVAKCALCLPTFVFLLHQGWPCLPHLWELRVLLRFFIFVLLPLLSFSFIYIYTER